MSVGGKEERLFGWNGPVEFVYFDSSRPAIDFESEVEDTRYAETSHHEYCAQEAVNAVSRVDYVKHQTEEAVKETQDSRDGY